MDGRRPPRARLYGARLKCHAKTLFRSCEPKQCKRLFERLATKPTGQRAASGGTGSLLPVGSLLLPEKHWRD
jgi:hypothetical protein